MVYSGFEHSTIFSQNYHASSSAACLDLMHLFIRRYTNTKMHTIFTLYVQMLLCTNYSPVSTRLDSKHTRPVNYYHQLLNRSDTRHVQDCTVSFNNYLHINFVNKSLELSQLPDRRLQHRRVFRPLRRFPL
jgi:hypothetical protein